MTVDEKLDFLIDKFSDVQQDIKGIHQEIHGMKQDIDGMKQDIDGMKQDIHGMKKDIVDMKADIKLLYRSDRLILDEVERVHNILEKHISDTNKHTA